MQSQVSGHMIYGLLHTVLGLPSHSDFIDFCFLHYQIGIFAATLFQKSQRALNWVSLMSAKPAALMLNSSSVQRGGTPESLLPVSFSALGLSVMKKEAKAPVYPW